MSEHLHEWTRRESTCRDWTRRTLAAGVAGIALLVVGAVGMRTASAQERVVVAHAAGINGQAVDKLLQEYSAETGAKAEGLTFSDTDYGARMQVVARAGNPAFDVALGVPLDIFALTQPSKIYASIDTASWDPAMLAAMREAKLIGPDYAVSQDTAALLVYSARLVNGPATWADFFDADRFPGNRGMASGGLGVPINIEYAMIAGGTAPDRVNPLDYDAAFKTLARLGSKLVLWDNAPKGIQDVVNGDTVMTWSYAPAALSALKAGQPIRIAAPPGTAVSRQIGVVMAGAPNGARAAESFLAWWFRPGTQVKYTEYTNYGIVVPAKAVLDRFSAEQSRYMPFSGPNPENFRILDYAYYGRKGPSGQSNLADALGRWSRFRAQ